MRTAQSFSGFAQRTFGPVGRSRLASDQVSSTASTRTPTAPSAYAYYRCVTEVRFRYR